ncbi:MAG: hypothetical protein ACE5PV_27565 [Candidatus Poribacteria bacterium]
MIQNDEEFRVTQSRIVSLQNILLSLRTTEKPSNYALMSKGYLMEIDKMQAEIMEYLSRIPVLSEASVENQERYQNKGAYLR